MDEAHTTIISYRFQFRSFSETQKSLMIVVSKECLGIREVKQKENN